MGEIRVHRTDQGIFWTTEYRITPLSRDMSNIIGISWITCKGMTIRTYLVADDCSISHTATVRLKTHLPVGIIGTQERHTHPTIAGILHTITHRFGPIFIVADGNICLMMQYLCRVLV